MGDLVKLTPYSEITATLEALDRAGVSQDDFRLIRSEKGLPQKIADLIHDRVCEIFAITVNYRQSLEKMIEAGRYDWKNSDINSKNFPIEKGNAVELEAQLIHFGKSISSDVVLPLLDTNDFRPATIAELLAFGAKYHEKQKEFPIVALSSVSLVGGYRSVACLDCVGGGRRLGLSWFDRDWPGRFRFLAVRK